MAKRKAKKLSDNQASALNVVYGIGGASAGLIIGIAAGSGATTLVSILAAAIVGAGVIVVGYGVIQTSSK